MPDKSIKLGMSSLVATWFVLLRILLFSVDSSDGSSNGSSYKSQISENSTHKPERQTTNLGDVFGDYEGEFYVYTQIVDPKQQSTGNSNSNNNNNLSSTRTTSDNNTVGQESIDRHRSATTGSKSSEGANVADMSQSGNNAQTTMDNLQPTKETDGGGGRLSWSVMPLDILGRNSMSARERAPDESVLSDPVERPAYCIGHSESELTFSWTCRGMQMVRVPDALRPKPTSLRLANMGIERLSSASLQPYKDTIRDFSIEGAPRLTTIESNVFANMSRLRVVYIFQAPRLISFDYAIMGSHPELTIIRIQQTGLAAWPDLSRFVQRKILSSIDLDNNKIETLGNKALNIRTELLNLEFNRIQAIEEHTFNGSEIGTLSFFGNRPLVYIHQNAFVNLRNLIKLDLSGTSVAQLPSAGWQNLRKLEIRDNYTLKQIPSIYAFPQLEEAHLTYAYHCCSFRYPQTHNPAAYEQHRRAQEELNAYCASKRKTLPAPVQSTTSAGLDELALHGAAPDSAQDDSIDGFGDFGKPTVNIGSTLLTTSSDKQHQQREQQQKLQSQQFRVNATTTTSNSSESFVNPSQASLDGAQIDCGELVEKANELPNISCTPEPDAFNPCEDIMGYPVLRVAVWFVVAASVLGNMCVIVVLVAIFGRLSVPKFLQLNLALGDLFMGVYLAMLAGADLSTKGTYFNYAIDWQHGIGCRLAGASSLFASQLSIFTLSVITFERYYTITYSIDLNMRLQLGWAARIMLVGWLFAITFALLPVVANINSYSKTSICLPMRTNYRTDRAFIIILLIVDSLAFLIIFICYLKMYLLILRQKTEATRKERTVAMRMALLVSTDFACWAPIIFFGATAVLGQPLISVSNSKILIVFFYPLNSMANPFLYVLTTRQYKRDLEYLAGRWRQWRANLFKKHKDQLIFGYNNHLHGPGQYPGGAQLNAHLSAVAAVTGVANHLRHYKLPISEQQKQRPTYCADFELAKSITGSGNALSNEASREPSDVGRHRAKLHENRLVSSGRQQAGSTGTQYIIRHTILADKCVIAEQQSCCSNKQRVRRALEQRAMLASAKRAIKAPNAPESGTKTDPSDGSALAKDSGAPCASEINKQSSIDVSNATIRGHTMGTSCSSAAREKVHTSTSIVASGRNGRCRCRRHRPTRSARDSCHLCYARARRRRRCACECGLVSDNAEHRSRTRRHGPDLDSNSRSSLKCCSSSETKASCSSQMIKSEPNTTKSNTETGNELSSTSGAIGEQLTRIIPRIVTTENDEPVKSKKQPNRMVCCHCREPDTKCRQNSLDVQSRYLNKPRHSRIKIANSGRESSNNIIQAQSEKIKSTSAQKDSRQSCSASVIPSAN